MRIVHNIFLSCLTLFSLANTASAQFQNHFQQVYVTGTDTNIQTKALDLVTEDDGKYVFTGTYVPPVLNTILRRPLLVKLQGNTPYSSPFAVEWAMTYLFPGFGEPNQPSPYNLDVQDVHYVTDKREYILCGSFNRGTFRIGGFLLRTDTNGYPLHFKAYWQINTLTSVVAKSNAASGFIAVGESKSNNKKGAAVIVSVTESLDVICVKTLLGRYKKGRRTAIFNKVITYGDDQFAAVGHTTHYPKKDKMLQDTDVLVATFDEQCTISKKRRYGHPPTFNSVTGEYVRYFEEGKSIVEVGNGKGLVVTGKTMKESIINQQSIVEFRDILLFRLRKNFGVMWMNHYDIDADYDVGLAVQIRNVDNQKTSIFVAGEAHTSYLSDNGNKVRDVILLETNNSNGQALGAELFGGSELDGMIRANVDLHLTPKEQYPLIMANTNSWTSYGSNNPYLIERYDNIYEKCYHTKVDVPTYEYDFPRNNVSAKVFKTETLSEDIKGYKQVIGGKAVCEKVPTI